MGVPEEVDGGARSGAGVPEVDGGARSGAGDIYFREVTF